MNRLFKRARGLAQRNLPALEQLFQVETFSGIVLLAATAAALIWANSPTGATYASLWHTSLTFAIGEYQTKQSLHFVVNDGLMTVFFLVVGMEVRREIHDGALASLRLAALPVVAALGGVAVPALIYLILNPEPPLRAGWAIPTATDIAFAVGVLALLRRSVPGNVRVLILALAIIDDVVAILIIAIAYSAEIHYSGLLIAAAAVLMVLAMHRLHMDSAYAYVVPGAMLWLGLWRTGVHPTLAGVILGMLTPVRAVRHSPRLQPPVTRVELALHPWVAYGVMPLFAFANAGINVTALDVSDAAAMSVGMGVFLALVVGKPVGVVAASWLAVRFNLCQLPKDVTWRWMILVGLLAGIGFTMCIFIAMLSFDEGNLLEAAKLSVLAASAASAGMAAIWGYECGRRAGHES